MTELTVHSDDGSNVEAGMTGAAAETDIEKASETEDHDIDAEMASATEPQADAADYAPEKQATHAQVFQLTISLRDDWLHRGDALQDLDLQTYAEYIERQAKPIRGTDMQKALARPIFAFDAHYKLAQGFMQVLKPGHRRSLARFNAPNCT